MHIATISDIEPRNIGKRIRRFISATTIPNVADLADYLPLQEAAKVYRTSPDSLYKLITAGRLTKYRRELDKRTWLRRSELDVIFRPKPAKEG